MTEPMTDEQAIHTEQRKMYEREIRRLREEKERLMKRCDENEKLRHELNIAFVKSSAENAKLRKVVTVLRVCFDGLPSLGEFKAAVKALRELDEGEK